jgi:hypothetical protein
MTAAMEFEAKPTRHECFSAKSMVRRNLQPAHAVILAVPHRCFVDEGWRS